MRGLIAASAAGLGWISVSGTAAYMMRSGASERAHALAPGDGRVTALAAERLSGAEASRADRARGTALARTALRQDATAVPAAIILGLDAQTRGDLRGARRLFAFADRLSRRELQTQLWAIEDGVARGDVPAVLRNYDVALRTSRNAPDLLFPILAGAISEGTIRRELLRVLAGDPAWGPSFINYASANADPRAAVSLFQAMARRGMPVTDEPRARLVAALIRRGLAPQAWAYYAATRPGVDPRRSRDPAFTGEAEIPTPFDWVPVDEGGVSASLQREGDGGVFDFAAPTTVGGPLLRQTQMLPPGDYRLAGRSTDIEQAQDALPYWLLACGDGSELGRFDVPNSVQAGGRFAGRFTVPTGCPTQVLMLVARPVDKPGGLTGRIVQAQLAPAR